ncbi:IPT/TIG domain-containing protein [Pelagicoccus mobilis]|uniref:Glycoside hydrolase family 2 catalytic domain-containing protein n=1 Tax=Pelagicoccus mobilis TaxID=415221 RepID=A0A934S2M1_9BACT|nr:IPT/TIG domain-containing protein [Pelagicoccus mobilis]MBK1877923.1 hypothetical protein [Pelagicoccus mobilis]
MSLLENVGPVKVEIRKNERGAYSLLRDGRPFWVKGAAGYQHLERLVEVGGNSVRTWGMDQTEAALPEIRRWGLTLCAGLWLVPPRLGFDYNEEEGRAKQFELIKEQVLSLRDQPCLLMWGVGNELELGVQADCSVWQAVEEVASFIKEVDSLHPVMTVLASVNVDALRCIEEFCPSIDLVCFNSYGDLEQVQGKLDRAGWNFPYLVTEWGWDGHWEVPKTEWGAEIEPTSTEKAKQVRRRYRRLGEAHEQCLGSYLFLWGCKQERTPTWYGVFDAEGRETEAVGAIEARWTGKAEKTVCPRISPIHIKGCLSWKSLVFERGEEVRADFDLERGSISEADVHWAVAEESTDKRVGGDTEAAPCLVECRITWVSATEIVFRVPAEAGDYRLFLKVQGADQTIATANFPFRVE